MRKKTKKNYHSLVLRVERKDEKSFRATMRAEGWRVSKWYRIDSLVVYWCGKETK